MKIEGVRAVGSAAFQRNAAGKAARDDADPHLDDRLFRAHRQGKTSFYMKSTGEEASAVAQSMVPPS